MYITNYQMHNVLKIYANQLSKGRCPLSEGSAVPTPKSVSVEVAAEGKRQKLIERIAADIVARIRNGAGGREGGPTVVEPIEKESQKPTVSPESRHAPFVYNVIRGAAQKKTHVLAVEDADFLARRFVELVRRMMDRGARPLSV